MASNQETLSEPAESFEPENTRGAFTNQLDFELTDGQAIVFGDCHYDPEAPPSTAHRAVVMLARDLQPAVIACDGDAFDFAGVSRHARIMWEARPKVAEELRIVPERLGEIAEAAPQTALFYSVGNHCSRLATFIAEKAGELEGVPGTRVEDYLPEWSLAWKLVLNPEARIPCVIKHRGSGNGDTAAQRNVTKCGTHIVTGHTHHLQMVAHTDWAGTRWAVDTGCVADVNSRLFAQYTEKGCTGWRSGLAILSFAAGEMLPPELVVVVKESPVPGKGLVAWRGRLWEV
jgi:hypothetical protein